MYDSFPLKNLSKINLMLSLVVSLFVMVFMMMGEGNLTAVLSFVLMSATIFMAIGFSHILIIVLYGKMQGGMSTTFKLHRYYLSYIYSSTIYLVVWPVFAMLAGVNWQRDDWKLFAIFIISGVLINAVTLVIQDYLILHHRKSKADLEHARLKVAHAQASNNLLKQQIHPHFLFNALSIMNTLYRKDLELGEQYMLHLADFLRVSLTNNNRLTSTLEEELKFCQDYMVMQGIRFGSALKYEVNVEEELKKTRYLPSFSLQPLLENAIKHNEFTLKMPLEIRVFFQSQYIVVVNNLKPKKEVPPSSSTGLTNLAERYRLWSGEDIIVSKDENTFTVSLKVSYENSDY